MQVEIQKCVKSGGRWQPATVGRFIRRRFRAKKYLRKRCVQGGQRGGDPKDKDDGEGGMAREEEDEILHRRS